MTDAAGKNATASFAVQPKISVSLVSGNVGDVVTVTGTGFAGSSALTPTFAGGAITLTGAASSNVSGGFSGTFVVPASTAGAKTVSVADASTNNATALFTVHPRINLSRPLR